MRRSLAPALLLALLSASLALPVRAQLAHSGRTEDDPYTFTDRVTVGGDSNVTQLTVKGNAAQTGNIVLVENDAGTDLFWVTAAGNAVALGTVTSTGGYVSPADVRTTSTGSVVINLRDYADTTDDDMAHAIIAANCTDTGSGTEDCDLTISVVEAGAAAEVRFNIDADGGVTIGSSNTNSVNLTEAGGSLTLAGGDLTLSADGANGNQGAKDEFIGLPRVKLVSLGTGTNGSTETTSYVDDSPTGEYAPIDGDVTEAEGSVDSIYRFGSSSYKASFASSATADDGFKATITGDDLEANESIGIWLYASETIAANDLQILLTDDGGARNFNIGAIPATTWTWVEVDISGLAAGTGDVVTEFGITLTAAGATNLGAFDLYMDQAWKWDSTDEEALGNGILYDGILSVVAVATASGSANTTSDLAEGTAYIAHYESGNDFLVWVTDQSSNSTFAFIAY